jgi:hypothetical protein
MKKILSHDATGKSLAEFGVERIHVVIRGSLS